MLIYGLEVRLGGRTILTVDEVEVIDGINVVLGPNGSGKTTLLRAIIGAVKPSKGKVERIDGFSYAPAEVFPASMPVREVLYSGKKRADYVKYAELLGISHLLDRDFSTLSSGERKLVLFAKALAEGNLVIADEPLSALDPKNTVKLIKVMESLRGQKAFLITSHDLDVVNIADKVVVMKEGKVIFQGSPSELTAEVLEEAYEAKVVEVRHGTKRIFYFDV